MPPLKNSRTQPAIGHPEHCGADAGCTTHQQKTHNTALRDVCYPWHPWHGRRVEIVEAIVYGDRSVFRCRLDGQVSRAALELPQWMFDRAVCCRMQAALVPIVGVADLRQLKQLLIDQLGNRSSVAVERWQIPSLPIGDADVSAPTQRPLDSAGPVPNASYHAIVAESPNGSAAESSAVVGSSASHRSSRRSTARRQGGGP